MINLILKRSLPNLKYPFGGVEFGLQSTSLRNNGSTATLDVAALPEDKLNLYQSEPYNLYMLEKSPPKTITLTKEEALHIYSDMIVIRKMETACAKLYASKHVRGFCHLCAGQEACVVGLAYNMTPLDTIITSYRAHGYAYLSNGKKVSAVLAELLGKEIGCSHGRGGSMHMYGHNFFGGNGIVGAQVPIGTGNGLGVQYKNEKAVSLNLYGDGAANQGQVFEAFNMAKLLNLPAIFVCENNHYGMGTSKERSSASQEYYKRGQFMPGIRVNGMCVLSVIEATKFCKEYSLTKGPIILELVTYRYFGHSMSDPGTSYRTREEVAAIRAAADPILLFTQQLIGSKLVTEAEMKAEDTKAKKIVAASLKESLAAKEPHPDTLGQNVYAKPLEKEMRGVLPWKPVKHTEKKFQM